MKKIYALPAIARSTKAGLLLLTLSISTLAFSQHKPEFGFVVKAGNFTPQKATTTTEYGFNNSVRLKAGSVYTLGLWQTLSMGKRFRISAELLYRNSFVVKEIRSWYNNSPGMPVASLQRQSINHSSLSIPVKLHYSFKKNGKTSLAIGGGVSRRFSQTVLNHFEYGDDAVIFSPNDYQERVSDWNVFSTDVQFTAGLFHRINPKTAVGLEYIFERTGLHNNYYYASSLILCDCLCDCGNGYGLQNTPKMNSFSVSLRHNILD
ncbi:MAG: outer membrane beta-barrel protein [Saprospiraceae bacterium]|nr:outer membrane beta-barrel protein [Saprospiraceae bacterium]